MTIRFPDLLAMLALAAAGPAALAQDAVSVPPAEAGLPQLGVMGTIPLFWGEADGLGDLLAGGEPHWARAAIERTHALRPIDALDRERLAGLELLLLAQPRALSPAENVALDQWVRDGGRLLLFADPMLTGESHFPLGDRRRPQDVVLLSPILAHWGLALEFVEDQPDGARLIAVDGAQLPVNLPGRFARDDAGQGCVLAGEAVLARCAIGRGQALILADAALLDMHDPHPAAPAALSWILRQAAGTGGDSAGIAAEDMKGLVNQIDDGDIGAGASAEGGSG